MQSPGLLDLGVRPAGPALSDATARLSRYSDSEHVSLAANEETGLSPELKPS